MSGLRQRMPATANTNLIASMAIAGIPPFNGFFSKFIIILACIQSGQIGYSLAAVVGSILTLASFMKVQKYAFFGSLKDKYKSIKEAPMSMQLAMFALAVICVAGGLKLLPSLKFFLNDAVKVLTDGTAAYAGGVLSAAAK